MWILVVLSFITWNAGVLFLKYLQFIRETRFKKCLEQALVEFNPEPLVKETIGDDGPSERHILDNKVCVDLVKSDFLSFSQHNAIKSAAADIIKVYGVGTCGPRSFYGTTEVHKLLEKKLAAFSETEFALVYSFGISTTSSVIGTYLGKNDVAFVDELINLQIISGLRQARCTVFTFKHNDANDLNLILNSLLRQNRLEKFNTRFIITEGIYEVSGDLCNLCEIMKVANNYKVRIIIDESYSFGAIGATGRGITEYLHTAKIGDVDVICGSLENAFGTVGGFSVGSFRAIETQIMQSWSFVFSASLSVFLVQSIITALDNMDDRPITLQLFSREVHDTLLQLSNEFIILSHFDSPLKVIVPKNVMEKDRDVVQAEIIEKCISEYKVYMKLNVMGICIHLNYDLFYNNFAKESLYCALQLAAVIVKKYQCVEDSSSPLT